MSNDESSASFHLPRRQFLIAGSAAVVGLASASLSAEVVGRDSIPMPLLSVGFSNRTLDELRTDNSRRVVPAGRLAVADPRLAEKGARITVHGFDRAAEYRHRPIEVGFRAYYPAIDPATGTKAPVLAWMSRHDRQGISASGSTSFTVPVDAADVLHFGIDRLAETRKPTRVRRMTRLFANERDERAEIVALAARSGANGLKLRRGTYFVAVRESDSDAVPSWSSLRLESGALKTFAGAEPSFSYLTLSIDAATI